MTKLYVFDLLKELVRKNLLFRNQTTQVMLYVFDSLKTKLVHKSHSLRNLFSLVTLGVWFYKKISPLKNHSFQNQTT